MSAHYLTVYRKIGLHFEAYMWRSSFNEFTLAACHSELLSAAKYEVYFDADSLQNNRNLTVTLLLL
jgi:hypothetical protein